MNEDLKILALELKSTREANNISLQAIFNRTRIDIKFLKAIEDGSFNVIDEIFIKAFLKEYASSVGLNQEEVIKKYELAKQGRLKDFEDSSSISTVEAKSEKANKVFVSPELEDQVQKLDSNSSKQFLVVVIGISFLVIIALLYMLFIKNRDAIIVQQRPFEDIQEELKNDDDKARFDYLLSDSGSTEVMNRAKLKLQITADSRVWMRVVIDKENQDEFFLEKDSSKVLNAFHNYSILIGNAGAVRFSLNGKPLNFTAARGEIKNISIDSSGLKLMYLNKDELIK